MRTSTVMGIVFAGIMLLVAVGGVALTAINAASTGPRPWMLDALGLAWFVALWRVLVAVSIFLIAWVAEGMSAPEVAPGGQHTTMVGEQGDAVSPNGQPRPAAEVASRPQRTGRRSAP